MMVLMKWDGYESTVTQVAIRDDHVAEAHFSPKRSFGASGGGGLHDVDLTNGHHGELVLIWPHRSRALPVFEGQKVNLRVAPNGKIVSIAYGLAIDRWRERDGITEATGIADTYPPFSRVALAKGERVILIPDQIQVPLTELRHVWVNFMNQTGLQFLGWEGGDIQEVESFSLRSVSEDFSFENLSPIVRVHPESQWINISQDKGKSKGKISQNTLSHLIPSKLEPTIAKHNRR
jgi:hypothetical protein